MSDVITTRIVLNVDLRNGHDGLAQIAKRNKIDIPNLKKNDIAFFANSDFTAAKMFTAKDEVVHYRPETTMELDDVIRMIAKGRNQSFEYTKKKIGNSIKKTVFEEYPFLEQRYENIAKRRAEAAKKVAVKSTKTSSSKK